MKYRLMTALLLMLCLLLSGAAAQTLPDLTVFSPGLTQMSEKLERGEQVEMTAELTVRDMLYARDLSLLQAMLDGMQLVYSGGGTLREGCDALKLIRSGETLFAADLVRNGLNAELSVNDRTFGLCLPEGFSGIAAAGDWISGAAILNRVPLISVCEAVEGLKAGEPLAAGFVVAAPLAVERTMSDDGTRLTKIHISSSVEREGEIWAVSGFLRQPAGRAPKDTAEITFARDEDNTLTATYSSTRSQSVSQKDKKGRVIVETALSLSGKLGGYGVTTKLKLRMQNDWTADGENLTEKLVMTVTLGHTDRTPGRRMQRLNDASAKLRCEMTVKSQDAAKAPVLIDEKSSLSVVFDGNTFLDVSVEGDVQVGGEARLAALAGVPVSSKEEIGAAFETAAERIAGMIYPRLGREAVSKAENGLE